MSYDLILFDLDGTLIETAPEIADGVNATLDELGLPRVPESLVRAWIGHGTRELMAQALAHVRGRAVEQVRGDGTLDAVMPRFNPHYLRTCGTRSHPYAGVEAALSVLRERGVRLAVVTNKEEKFAFPVLERHGLRDYLDLVICGDTLAAKKPDPLPVQHCIGVFAGSPQRTLFVGDSAIDVATARAAGIDVWAVPYGYNHGRPIETAHPDRVIANFAELALALTGEPLRDSQFAPL